MTVAGAGLRPARGAVAAVRAAAGHAVRDLFRVSATVSSADISLFGKRRQPDDSMTSDYVTGRDLTDPGSAVIHGVLRSLPIAVNREFVAMPSDLPAVPALAGNVSRPNAIGKGHVNARRIARRW